MSEIALGAAKKNVESGAIFEAREAAKGMDAAASRERQARKGAESRAAAAEAALEAARRDVDSLQVRLMARLMPAWHGMWQTAAGGAGSPWGRAQACGQCAEAVSRWPHVRGIRGTGSKGRATVTCPGSSFSSFTTMPSTLMSSSTHPNPGP